MRTTKTIIEYTCDICGKICDPPTSFWHTTGYGQEPDIGVSISFTPVGIVSVKDNEMALCQMCINKAVKAYIKEEGIDINA